MSLQHVPRVSFLPAPWSVRRESPGNGIGALALVLLTGNIKIGNTYIHHWKITDQIPYCTQPILLKKISLIDREEFCLLKWHFDRFFPDIHWSNIEQRSSFLFLLLLLNELIVRLVTISKFHDPITIENNIRAALHVSTQQFLQFFGELQNFDHCRQTEVCFDGIVKEFGTLKQHKKVNYKFVFFAKRGKEGRHIILFSDK